MADRSVRYTPEFKRQMVALHRAGRTAASLSKEFGPSAWTIGLWIKQAARDEGTGDGGLTSAEREELARLVVHDTIRAAHCTRDAPVIGDAVKR